MNNFTKTEALPKSGHVTEVCKEWLVREDSALAYKLQSQEINDFYKGNRFRNAVVREDFPTALHEQIKEKENAEKQTEAYRRRLMEQEEHDKRVAKQISAKLERDLKEQREKQLLESEIIAQQMQEIYVNLPPVPPPASRDKHKPPPRPAKASILQQNPNEPSTSHARQHSHQPRNHLTTQVPQNQLFSDTNGYVGICLDSSMAVPQRQTRNANHLLVSDRSPNGTAGNTDTFIDHHKHRHQHSASSASNGSNSSRHNVFEFINATSTSNSSHTTHSPPKHSPLHPTTTSTSPKTQPVDELIEYSDVADSIRRYDISSTADALDSSSSPLQSPATHSNFNKVLSPSHENLLRNDKNFQKLSPEKYDQLVGNDMERMGAAAERHMQQHADDIELYADPCDYASLKEIGLPMEEIKEMSKKLKQEQKDELLARRLQQMESKDGLTQEERDRLLAIEAQDKELAKMLQEREKAKAKRAKEKARLRKSQLKETSSSSLCSKSNGLHCGPLLPLPQDCMFPSKRSAATTSTVAAQSNSKISAKTNAHIVHEEDPLDLEAYSNPIDVIHTNQRSQNGTLTNGSLTRDSANGTRNNRPHSREDDIYTLPVDSCRAAVQRPASLAIAENPQLVVNLNSMSRSENYSSEQHDVHLNGYDVSPRINYSTSGSFDQSSSPTPPYMPIQGTRRSNSSEDRKKKSKDKCTHQ